MYSFVCSSISRKERKDMEWRIQERSMHFSIKKTYQEVGFELGLSYGLLAICETEERTAWKYWDFLKHFDELFMECFELVERTNDSPRDGRIVLHTDSRV